MSSWGAPVSKSYKVLDNASGVKKFISEFLKRRHELEHEIDGVVVKVNERSIQDLVGTTSRAQSGRLLINTRLRK